MSSGFAYCIDLLSDLLDAPSRALRLWMGGQNRTCPLLWDP